MVRIRLSLCLSLLAAVPAVLASHGGSTRAEASPASGGPVFTDEAGASGLDFVHFNGMSGELYLVEITGSGGALFDYDGDGDLDVYMVQGRMLGAGKEVDDAVFPPEHPLPLSDRLYRNDLAVHADGSRTLRFTDVTEESGLSEIATGYGMGVATGDYDNDGRVDLYVASYGPNRLLRNRGPGEDGVTTFGDATAEAGADDARWSVAATFFDYDRDGWLDLYVLNYVDFELARHRKCNTVSGAPDYCSPLAYEPVEDRLLRNLGPGPDGVVTFEDVSERTGIAAKRGNGLGVAAADLDGDGWPDVFVANDQMPNFLWINQEGEGGRVFREDAVLAGVAVNREGRSEASMGVAIADFDGDGDEDVALTHLSGETHTYYRNDGGGLFVDDTARSGLGPPSMEATGFGTGVLDYDGDGRLDLFVANGAVQVLEAQARAGETFPLRQRDQLFRNLGEGRFAEVTAEAGPALQALGVGRGVAVGDVDGDGDPDLLVIDNSGPARLLLNRVGPDSDRDRPWVGLRLVGRDGKRDMLGARVALYRKGAPPLWRRVHTDGSYASAGDPRVLFGLGGPGGTGIETLRVHWPDGSVEEHAPPELGRYTTLRQGSGKAVSDTP